jgi:hypothetical protein
MENEPADKRCGAKLRGKNRYCNKRPMQGRARCRLHGGATPRGQHMGNRNAVTHGLYAKVLDRKLIDDYEQNRAALSNDPRGALLDQAALIMTQAQRVVKASPDGFLKLESTRKTVKGDAWETDDGKTVPAGEVETERTEKHVEITAPLAEALLKAARMAQIAHDIPMTVAKTRILDQGHDPDREMIPGTPEYDEMLLREWGYDRTGAKSKDEQDGPYDADGTAEGGPVASS